MKDPKTMTNEELVNQFRINVMIMEIKCLKTELMSRLQSTVSHEFCFRHFISVVMTLILN